MRGLNWNDNCVKNTAAWKAWPYRAIHENASPPLVETIKNFNFIIGCSMSCTQMILGLLFHHHLHDNSDLDPHISCSILTLVPIHQGISIDSAAPPVDHPSLITFRTLSISLINVTANGVLLETKFSPWNQWRDYVVVSLTFNPKVRCTCQSMNVTMAVCHVFFCAWMLVWMLVDMRIKTSALSAMVILGLIDFMPSLKKSM